MTDIKIKPEWRERVWILCEIAKAELSEAELKSIQRYWFVRWSFTTGHKEDWEALNKINERIHNPPKRALRGNWTIESAADIEIAYGLDVEDELIRLIAEEIRFGG